MINTDPMSLMCLRRTVLEQDSEGCITEAQADLEEEDEEEDGVEAGAGVDLWGPTRCVSYLLHVSSGVTRPFFSVT